MNKKTLRIAGVLLIGITLSLPAAARPPTQVKSAVNRTENPEGFGEYMILPYAFSSESTDFVVGVGGMRKGFLQEQMLIGGLGFVGEESYGGFGGVWDYRVPFLRRAFVSASGMLGYYPQHRAYTVPRDVFLPPGVIRPGSNDSSDDVYLEAKGDSNWLDIKIDYVWEMGAAEERGHDPISDVRPGNRDRVPALVGRAWNKGLADVFLRAAAWPWPEESLRRSCGEILRRPSKQSSSG